MSQGGDSVRYEVSPEAWRRPGARLSRATKITYRCPADGLDPFDIDEAATQHFFKARGWCLAWPSNEQADKAAFQEAMDGGVPMGYTDLDCYEKLAVLDGGILLAEWDELTPPKNPKNSSHPWQYSVLSQQINLVNVYQDELAGTFREVARRSQSAAGNERQKSDFLSLPSRTYWQALRLALTLGEVIKTPMMVARRISSTMWH